MPDFFIEDCKFPSKVLALFFNSFMSNPIRLAIADDHAVLRKGIISLTARHDIELVAEASNGKELIDQLSNLTVLPDVCLLDINMPVMNGYATLEAIKKEWPQIHVLALSMHATEFPIIKMLRGGAGGYLLKDGDPEEIQKAITAVVRHGFYYSDQGTAPAIASQSGADSSTSPNITDKEMKFLSWCCCDLAYKEIAQRMDISPRTVESYAEILCRKFQVKSRIGLVTAALGMGIDPAE
jgi:DNA-binding NarL/FixJ family response regulator